MTGVQTCALPIFHRADRLADILALLAPKAGSFRIRPIAPFADAPAKRVIVRAIKTGKAPLILLPPLVLHDRDGGGHSAAAEAILRGDAALANPPFFDDAGAIRGPAAERRGAWMADDGLEAWIGFLLKAVREGGTITLIHRADRLADILALLAPKAGSCQVLSVLPFADQPAKRVLVRAIKSGKAPLRLLPPLILHDREGGKHTPEAEAILRGEAGLGWT